MLLRTRFAAFLAGALICGPSTYELFSTTNSNFHLQAATSSFNIERRTFMLPEDPAMFSVSQNEPLLHDWAGISFDGTDGGIYEISYFVKNITNIIHVTHQLRTDATGQHTVITTIQNSGHHLLNYGFPKYSPNYPDSNNLSPYDPLPATFTKFALYNSNLSRYDEYTLPDGYLDGANGLPAIDTGSPDQNDDPSTSQNETVKDDIFIQDFAEQISIGGKSIIGKIVHTVDLNSQFIADYGNTIKLIGPGNDFQFRYTFEKLGTGEFRFHLNNSGVDAGNIVNYKVIELNPLNEDSLNPTRFENLQILKQLNNFEGAPTHYMIDPNNSSQIVDDAEIESPQTAGERPGFNIVFDHPLDLGSQFTAADNPATPDIDELASNGGYDKYQEMLMDHGEYLQGKFSLSSYDKDNIQFFFDFSTDPYNPSLITVHNNPKEVAQKHYIPPTTAEAANGKVAGYHQIKVVQNDIFKPEIDDSFIQLGGEDETGADAEPITKEYLEWSSLSSSELMDTVEIEIVADDNPHTFEDRFINRTYESTGSVHTYMEFRVERISLNEARLTYVPYKGLSNNTKYNVYNNKEATPDNLIDTGYDYVSDSFPVPILSSGEQGYLMEAIISDKTNLLSQYLKYNAATDTNIKPPTPLIDEITNIYVVPPEEPLGPTQAIGFDITFSAPKNTEENRQLDQLVDDGTLYYELLMYDTKETPANKRVYSKIFKVDRVGEIEISAYAGDAGTASYNPSSETFTVSDVLLKQNHGRFEWNQLDDTDFANDQYLNEANYPAAPSEVDLSYPQWDVGKTYYFTLRAVYDRDASASDESSTLTFSNESNPVPITFTNKAELLPIVTVITDEPVIFEDSASANQRLNFNIVNLEYFVDYMLDPIDWAYAYEDVYDNDTIIDKYGRTYEVFLYQQDEPSAADFETAVTVDDSDITVAVPKQSIDVDMDDYITHLRNGAVVQLDFVGYDNILPQYAWPTIEYNDLDQNQTYYVQIRTRVDSADPNTPPQYSTFSKIHTFTTHLTPQPPSPEEQKPPAPADFWIEEQEGNNSVSLRWDPPNYQADAPIYYELIRTEDTRLDAEILSDTLSLENVLMQDPSLAAFATGGHFTDGDDRVYSVSYNGAGFTTKLLDPQLFSSLLKLEDKTLTPNTIYYYYLRTVANIDNTLVHSEWISQPVTTSPVESPAQLKIEKTTEYDYLPTDEVVISFIAPIPVHASVPKDYDFEIAIKGEEEDFSFANAEKYGAERLTPNDDAPTPPEGYQYYVYHLTGLESSTRYDIKVRIIDYTTDVAADEEPPRSLYSNSISYQTEVDDEDEQDKSRLEEYLDKFDRLVLELKGQPYWPLLETFDTGIYKFKEAYLDDALATDTFELFAAPTFTTAEYYFPGQSFEDGHDATLTAEIGDFAVNIRPDTFDRYLDEISDARSDVRSNKIEDYYIKLTLYTNEINFVNGEKPLTDELNIELEVVHLDEKDIYIEVELLDEITDLIEDGRESVEEDLQDALASRVTEDDQLLEIVEDAVANIATRHQDATFEVVHDAIERDKNIKELETAVLVSAAIDSYNATAFIYDRGWRQTFAFRMFDGWATEITEPAAIVFAGTPSVGPNINIAPPEQDAVNRYDLDTTFGTKLGPSNTASKEQLYTAIASILGADAYTDPVAFLLQQGFRDVTRVNLTGSVTQEEAIYMAMQLYEKINFISVSSIMIHNRLAVPNISEFKPHYRQYIMAAVELGLANPNLSPTMPMNPADLQTMLAKIATR
ncbi:hypothetical protein [Candidatus Epulonipiscium viviparus]|uniref:hypothetical protein n=1 Tax=Candidatus Epulonipiscium viviparus TaxID=420336 RepID=UPI0004966181|nr:hypothetical protein [Candidatus Epulopiscium viviparus]